MCHDEIPIPKSKKENSLICAMLNPVFKEVLSVNQYRFMITRTKSGLIKSTNNVKNITHEICSRIAPNSRCIPILIKNSTKKKSLNEMSLFAISLLYGDKANDIHAIKLPISKEKPRYRNKVPNNKHHPIHIKSKYSFIHASTDIIFGITNFEIITTPRININPPHSIIHKSPLPHFPLSEIPMSKSITTISCTINTPVVIFPRKVSCSCLSESNFTITIVLEKVSHTAIYAELVPSYHKNLFRIHHKMAVHIICIIPIPKAVFPCSLITFGFNHNHTIKSKSAIPRCENNSIKL